MPASSRSSAGSRGQRPLALGHHRFQWLYVFGFVRPATGEGVWFLADAVNTAMFSEILAAFAREVGAGPDNLVVLVLDGAGWHVAKDLVVPEGIRLEFLPPYSPRLYSGFGVVGSRAAKRAPSKALPRHLALCTNSKRAR